jgi:hypothetical protein
LHGGSDVDERLAAVGMSPLPTWMRRALLATAAMNAVGAVTFTPWGARIRDLAGMPPNAHPIYLLVIGAFVLLFGVGYLWCGITGRADPLFVAIAAAGKLAFFGLLLAFAIAGELSPRAPLAAVGDLVFGVLFVAWLVSLRR